MFGNIGLPELVIIFVVALLVFGPKKLPELGKSLGKSIAEFKKASNELRSTLDEEIRQDDVKQQATPPPAAPAPPALNPPQAPAPAVSSDTVSRDQHAGS